MQLAPNLCQQEASIIPVCHIHKLKLPCDIPSGLRMVLGQEAKGCKEQKVSNPTVSGAQKSLTGRIVALAQHVAHKYAKQCIVLINYCL